MRLCLSQIREWVVEYSADTLFISMRTNVAWYRLTTCASTLVQHEKSPLNGQLALPCNTLADEYARLQATAVHDRVMNSRAAVSQENTICGVQADGDVRAMVLHGPEGSPCGGHYPPDAR